MEEETSPVHHPEDSGSLEKENDSEDEVSSEDDFQEIENDEESSDDEEPAEIRDEKSKNDLVNNGTDPSVSDGDYGLLKNVEICDQNTEEEKKGNCDHDDEERSPLENGGVPDSQEEKAEHVAPSPTTTGTDIESTVELKPDADNNLSEQAGLTAEVPEVVKPEAEGTEVANHESEGTEVLKPEDEVLMPELEQVDEVVKPEAEGSDLTTSKEKNEPPEEKKEEEEDKPSDEWLDVLGNGLLMKKTLQAGKGNDTRPTRGQKVTLKATGALEDGTPVDCHDEISFIVGDGDIISAWDICVTLMQLGEVCELKSDSKYCYGSYGSTDTDPAIPANANLTYVLDLVAVEEGPDIEKLSNEERITLGEKKKCYGNKLYSRGDYSGAINVYTRALKYLEPSSSEEVVSLKVVCWNNLAACQLKINAYQAAHNSCLQVLNIEPNNVKALYRKGKVLSLQGEYDEAMVYIKKANVLDPNNKTVTTELSNLRKQQATQLKKEKDMYQRMVSGLNEKRTDDKNSQSSFMTWQVLLGATIVAVGGILAALFMSKHQ